jgi:hypothetical protein
MKKASTSRKSVLILVAIACAQVASCKKKPAEASAPAEAKRVTGFQLMCEKPVIAISPHIYGIAFDVSGYANWRDEKQWELGATGRRFGGNAATRYNFEHGTAFNHGLDWFFENNGDSEAKEPTYVSFLSGNDAHKALSATQLPMIGWMAKDTTSVSFAVSKFPGQKFVDEKRKAGKGIFYSGRDVDPPAPTETSIAAPPEKVAEAVKLIAKHSKGERIYILDNEPALWHVTHRDVHPDPISYDELISRTIRYAEAVRAADPKALIAGPAAYGWNEYFESAKDLASPSKIHRDREAHGGDPLLVYYLKKLQEHEKKTGVRLLDLLDVHFYPQADGIGVGLEGAVTSDVAKARIRSPRALWDPSYVDESWIAEPIKLLPRLREWIDANYPGTRVQIGEWNLGAEKHISSGLAVAETLGQFAKNSVYSAFYWTYPPAGSPAAMGFRAFRNFDGNGGAFGSLLVPSASEEGTSLFVSRDAEKKRWVVVALNLEGELDRTGTLDFSGCGVLSSVNRFEYMAESAGFAKSRGEFETNRLQIRLPKQSIAVFEIEMK